MSPEDRPSIDTLNLLFERIRNTMGESASQRQSLDAHLNVLENLEQNVAELEARIEVLESQHTRR